MFNLLTSGRPFARAILQTIVLTSASAAWLLWSSFTFAVKS